MPGLNPPSRQSSTVLFGAAIFLGAALLFVVQPMFAKAVLPKLGGAPAVWATAMVFFQAALLAAYAYGHFTLARLSPKRQAWLHLAVLLTPLAVLPIGLPAGWVPPAAGNPIGPLLGVMAVSVGLPFFAVATTSPVLQRWFNEAGGGNPYFLYAASNAGSLLALLAYPILIEPLLPLATQSSLWRCGYWAFVVLVAVCAWRLWRAPASPSGNSRTPLAETPIAKGSRLRWLLLSFVPSSLLLGVTTYLSSEVAAVPLLWIVPLALYLLTFVLAFASRPLVSLPLLQKAVPLSLVPLVLAVVLQARHPILPLILLHLTAFFVAALYCHTKLSAERPPAANLTEFYLWLSIGGALGGVFNALVAPLVFTSIVEYPAAIVAAAATLCVASDRVSRRDVGLGLALGVGVCAALLAGRSLKLPPESLWYTIVVAAGALAAFLLSRRPWAFLCAIGALLCTAPLFPRSQGGTLEARRSFFGEHRVTLDPTGQFRYLMHGVTLHGSQTLIPELRRIPLTYYHPTGPAGDIMTIFNRKADSKVAAVGLGAGSLASYARNGQSWTYFEIDPVVEAFARDDRYFTFLKEARAPIRVVLGDARLTLAREPDAHFDLLILDAYSSDAIPVHLVTREALALYCQKLAPGGILAFHISNVHLDLEPVFGNLARDAGLASLMCDDTNVPEDQLAAGKSPSQWLVMARDARTLEPLIRSAGWQKARERPADRVWSDDYSSLLKAFRW